MTSEGMAEWRNFVKVRLSFHWVVQPYSEGGAYLAGCNESLMVKFVLRGWLKWLVHFVAEMTCSSKHRVPVLEGHRSCVGSVSGNMKHDWNCVYHSRSSFILIWSRLTILNAIPSVFLNYWDFGIAATVSTWSYTCCCHTMRTLISLGEKNRRNHSSKRHASSSGSYYVAPFEDTKLFL